LSAYFLSTSTFAAPQLTSADRATITQCIGTFRNRKDYGETSCAGIIPNPCIKAANSRNSQVSGAAACAGRELRVWDERLQASLKIVNASFPLCGPRSQMCNRFGWNRVKNYVLSSTSLIQIPIMLRATGVAK
jgi:hypothetical protein